MLHKVSVNLRRYKIRTQNHRDVFRAPWLWQYGFQFTNVFVNACGLGGVQLLLYLPCKVVIACYPLPGFGIFENQRLV